MIKLGSDPEGHTRRGYESPLQERIWKTPQKPKNNRLNGWEHWETVFIL